MRTIQISLDFYFTSLAVLLSLLQCVKSARIIFCNLCLYFSRALSRLQVDAWSVWTARKLHISTVPVSAEALLFLSFLFFSPSGGGRNIQDRPYMLLLYLFAASCANLDSPGVLLLFSSSCCLYFPCLFTVLLRRPTFQDCPWAIHFNCIGLGDGSIFLLCFIVGPPSGVANVHQRRIPRTDVHLFTSLQSPVYILGCPACILILSRTVLFCTLQPSSFLHQGCLIPAFR